MINKVNVKAAIQYSIVGAVLFAATSTYATTIEFSEDYNGTFTVSGNNFSYDLATGDGSYPFLASTGSSSLSCDSIVGCTGTGTFVRDEDFGNTFSGTYNYVISAFDFFDEGENEVFNYSINYVGELNITSGTGSYDGATGTGSFTGTDYYYTIRDFLDEGNSAQRSLARFIPPTGETEQYLNWIVSTSEVPLPAAAWLFGSSLLGFVSMRRKASV